MLLKLGSSISSLQLYFFVYKSLKPLVLFTILLSNNVQDMECLLLCYTTTNVLLSIVSTQSNCMKLPSFSIASILFWSCWSLFMTPSSLSFKTSLYSTSFDYSSFSRNNLCSISNYNFILIYTFLHICHFTFVLRTKTITVSTNVRDTHSLSGNCECFPLLTWLLSLFLESFNKFSSNLISSSNFASISS